MDKKTKIQFIILSIIFILISFLSIYFVYVVIDKQNNTEPLNFSSDKTVGVWWWNNNLDKTKYLNFASNNDVNEVYYCDTSFSEGTSDFINLAKQKGIKVYLLCGEKEWIEDDSSLQTIINDYRNYQTNNPLNQFSGIHLDVEPHQFEDFKSSDEIRKVYMEKYVSFVKSITTNNPDIQFDFDIAFWFDDIIEFSSEEKPVYQHIIDSANRVFVMSYRDTAEQIVDVAKEEIEYSKQLNKKIFVCVELRSSEGDYVSFQEESKEILYQELNKIKPIINYDDYGISIHHIETWFELRENL